MSPGRLMPVSLVSQLEAFEKDLPTRIKACRFFQPRLVVGLDLVEIPAICESRVIHRFKAFFVSRFGCENKEKRSIGLDEPSEFHSALPALLQSNPFLWVEDKPGSNLLKDHDSWFGLQIQPIAVGDSPQLGSKDFKNIRRLMEFGLGGGMRPIDKSLRMEVLPS